MIKLTGLMVKKPGWSREEWLTHYKEHHGSLALSIRSYMDEVVRYVQNYSLAPPAVPKFPELMTELMGVAELSFREVAGFERATNSQEYLTYLRPDEKRFIDFDKSSSSIGTERGVYSSADKRSGDKAFAKHDRYRILAFKTRPNGMTRQDFQQAWHGASLELSKTADFYREYVRRHVQTDCITPDQLPGNMPVAHFDLVDELWFESVADAIAYWAASKYANQRRYPELDSPMSPGMTIVEEHQVLIPKE